MAMIRGEASFQTEDGSDYQLVIDLAAFAEAEEVCGLAPDELMQALQPAVDAEGNITRKPKLKHLGALFYGALKAKNPAITPSEAINLMGDSPAAGAALAKAIEGAVPKASAGGKGRSRPGTGTKR